MRDNKTTPDGREIVAREPASGPHPRFPEKIVPFRTINRLLLTDESTVYECEPCGKVHANFRSILSHQPSHGDRPPTQYDEKTLRAIATAVRRNWTERKKFVLAADELNERKVPPARGGEWNSGMVRRMFVEHCQEIRVNIRRPKADPIAIEPVSAPPDGAGTGGRLEDPIQTKDGDRPYLPLAIDPTADAVRYELAVVAVEMERLMAHLWRIREAVEQIPAADLELADKALRYDQMVAAFQPISREAPRG